ncbi:MAG: MBL fold metallo-hydrolase [Bacteroidia bacterium]|nr:MBL fold metallo-hydrolase [Bacteroidia bacterium]
MKLEQIYTGCLAEAAYYIESKGEAVIIDPLRESAPYIERAEKDGARIKYIFETHFHADFVSGHVDLAKKTGADIIYGPTSMETGFEKIVAEDGQIFNVGDVTIEVLHTPGHTMESSCFLLREKGKEVGVFTGDTLFIGDVGRPDLAQKVIPDLTQDKLARHLFKSLRNKLMTLPDDVIVYPAHGAGSACGKNMSSETQDTLGNQKKTNYALRADMTEDEFVKEVLDGLMPPPGYFPQNVLLNITGYESLDDVLEQGTRELSPREFELVAEETEALIIDTRSKDEFRAGFIPNSIFIGIDGSFATWVGTMIPDVKQELLIVADEDRIEEVITRLARVGYDNAKGYLKGGFEAWKKAGKEFDRIESVGVEELAKLEDPKIVDIRKASEFKSEHIIGALNAPLDYVNESMKLITNDGTKQYIHCATGYRSLVFASILQARGYRDLVDVKGGFEEIKESDDFKISDYICPTTML